MKNEKDKPGERERIKEIIRQAIAEIDLGKLLKDVVKVELAKLRGKVE